MLTSCTYDYTKTSPRRPCNSHALALQQPARALHGLSCARHAALQQRNAVICIRPNNPQPCHTSVHVPHRACRLPTLPTTTTSSPPADPNNSATVSFPACVISTRSSHATESTVPCAGGTTGFIVCNNVAGRADSSSSAVPASVLKRGEGCV